MITEDFHSKITVEIPIQYKVRTVPSPKEAIFLLHGYAQNSSKILDKLISVLPSTSLVVSANGPFVVPEKVDGTYRVGFSWYFYDFSKDEYYIGMKSSMDMWIKIVEELKIQNLPKRLLGYSQGGYLAPFVAKELKNVVQVIGISCQFLDEELEPPLPFRMDAIHGADDDVCSPVLAEASLKKLNARGISGEFVSLPKVGHRISAETLKAVESLIKKGSL